MIFIDESELRQGSTMPPVEGSKPSACLEEHTGADIMVSTSGIPASSPTLIHKHVQSGAILIQVKRGTDFLSSIADERINVALARMKAAGARRAWQRLVISTGVFLPDLGTGEVLVGVPRLSASASTYVYVRAVNEGLPPYKALATVRWRIAARGGYYLPLTCDDELPAALLQIENDLKWMQGKPTKEIFPPFEALPPDEPEEDDPLQLPVEVRDGRLPLSAMSGVGKVKATALWEAIREWNRGHYPGREDDEPTLAQALFWASCSNPRDFGIPKVKGWGEGMRERIRGQLGLEEGMNVRIMLDDWGEKE